MTGTAIPSPGREPLPAVDDALLLAFPTPVVNYFWPDVTAINAELTATILACESADAGVHRSNVGGWHSGTDFLAGSTPAVVELRARIEAFVAELTRKVHADPRSRPRTVFRIEGWANILRTGQYHGVHCHPNAFWSGVYYVAGNRAPPGERLAGRLELIDPRPAAAMVHSDDTWLSGRMLINPAAGQMVVFPAWLQHYVHPVAGDEPRITVAFNAMVAGPVAG
jgi:uncharacterized protein (TIGR02466 family)